MSIQAMAIKEDVGYPPYILDDSKLDSHYSTVSNQSPTNWICLSPVGQQSLHEISCLSFFSIMLYSYY